MSAAPAAAAAAAPSKNECLLEPCMVSDTMEVSVHACSRRFRRELQLVFPGRDLHGLLALPVCQRAENDLVQVGPDVAKEKDDLLEKFRDWALELSRDLANAGAWTDYIDPCSGLPALSDASNAVYPEVDGFEALLHYRASSAAGCRVILHPRWGTHVYPATVFTTAHPDAVLAAVKKRSARQEEGRRHAAPPRD